MANSKANSFATFADDSSTPPYIKALYADLMTATREGVDELRTEMTALTVKVNETHVAQTQAVQTLRKECRSEIVNTRSLTDTYEIKFSGIPVAFSTKLIDAAKLMHRALACPEADNFIFQCRLWQPRKAATATIQDPSAGAATGADLNDLPCLRPVAEPPTTEHMVE
ncbi:hypothetical protein QAD02_000531 [Eretmocerus hayati]|uniref:Uncharacterized protein n=1 Tax=Eretmocerus hayati TaxID=131215 RepID=A0ACC2NDN7_9HYME|nr:hypothetical protein QAD02_000531 [Eretmocerus hayati]